MTFPEPLVTISLAEYKSLLASRDVEKQKAKDFLSGVITRIQTRDPDEFSGKLLTLIDKRLKELQAL